MALLYGIHPVLEALKASAGRIERVCVDRRQQNPRLQEIIELCRRGNVALSFEEKSWLDRRAGGQRHQGALCYVAETATTDVAGVLEAASPPGLLLVLDGIEDPRNLGAIIRSAEVAGAGGVILPRWRSAGISPAVIRASAGAAAHIRIARAPNLSVAVDKLKQAGYWIVGLDPQGDRPIWEVDLTGSIALVLGGEGSGMRRLVRESCDFLALIPMGGKVGSFNAAVSAGIALYECRRQRNWGRPTRLPI